MSVQKVLVLSTMINIKIGTILLAVILFSPGFYSTVFDKTKIDKHYFQYACVTQNGYDVNVEKNGSCLEVAATPAVDPKVLEKGTRLLFFMVRFMREDLFLNIVQNISVGIFSSNEFPSSFPEYLPDKNHTDCFYSCPEICSAFCDQGKPIGIRWSYPGRRIVVVDGNIVCGQNHQFDPEFGSKNLLVQDFAEALIKYVMAREWIVQLKHAFMESSKARVWKLSPANYVNYFRQGTVTWFRSTMKTDDNDGNIHMCPDGNICSTEKSIRENILNKDFQLYDILNSTYNYHGHGREHNVSVCTW